MAQRKPYNPNTAYGRRKLREQAQYNYDNGTPEYRREIDNIGGKVYMVILGVILAVFFMIALIAGPEAAIKWLK